MKDLYDYECKYTAGMATEREFPADLCPSDKGKDWNGRRYWRSGRSEVRGAAMLESISVCQVLTVSAIALRPTRYLE